MFSAATPVRRLQAVLATENFRQQNRKRLHGAKLDGAEHFQKIAKMSLDLLGLLLELLLELPLLLLYAFIT